MKSANKITLVLLAIASFTLAIVAITFLIMNIWSIYYPPTYNPYYNDPAYEIKGFEVYSINYDDINASSIKILYNTSNNSWYLQNDENYGIFVKESVMGNLVGRSKLATRVEYIPNITIDCDDISLEFGIRNFMRADVVNISFEVIFTTENETQIISDIDYLVTLDDIKENEYTQIQIKSKLPVPSGNETLKQTIIFIQPINAYNLEGGLVEGSSMDYYIPGKIKFEICNANA